MKTCPTCKKTYKDDGLNYCLDDGATLVAKRGVPRRHSRLNEAVAIALLGVAALIFLSLVSSSPSDPSFSTSTTEPVRNWIGVVGSHIADVLLQTAGIVSYIFPALLALIAWRVFQSESLRPKWYRVVGFLLFVGSAAGLVTMIGWRGGIIGAFFATYAMYLLSTLGATILLGTMFLVSVLMISDLSYIDFWGHFDVAWQNFKIRFADWRAKRSAARMEAAELAKQHFEKRKETRAGLVDSPTITLPDAPKTRVSKKKTVETCLLYT
ncbi:MAG: DNA translocase FtsK 4TM domain-containing protein, partial [Pyrinomonadaceae bacterium]|nr:DNA translocase FtsK 4TM domain-containing protein [Pyrinomonadaceae bacterium]